MKKIYQQIAGEMAPPDFRACFNGCWAFDKTVNELVQLNILGNREAEVTTLTQSPNTSKIVTISELVGGDYELFPPEEGVALDSTGVVYCATRRPARHYRKGMLPNQYSFAVVGSLASVSATNYTGVAKGLYRPNYYSLEEAFAMIHAGQVAGVPVGRWWSVAFHAPACCLCLFWRTTPVVALESESRGTLLFSNDALRYRMSKDFPQLTLIGV